MTARFRRGPPCMGRQPRLSWRSPHCPTVKAFTGLARTSPRDHEGGTSPHRSDKDLSDPGDGRDSRGSPHQRARVLRPTQRARVSSTPHTGLARRLMRSSRPHR
ncbi:hypothetical protein NL676_006092 [Syzygium grande]|nr:hypothetical protein NL676_006092 [Syzygium grande]